MQIFEKLSFHQIKKEPSAVKKIHMHHLFPLKIRNKMRPTGPHWDRSFQSYESLKKIPWDLKKRFLAIKKKTNANFICTHRTIEELKKKNSETEKNEFFFVRF